MTRRTQTIKSRARGQLLLRRLEPEAAGAPRGRFVAVHDVGSRRPAAAGGRDRERHVFEPAHRARVG